MLSDLFDSRQRIQALQDGPGGALLEGFVQELSDADYANITVRRHIRAAEHFIYWAARKGLPACSLNEQVLHQFSCHLKRCYCPGYGGTPRGRLVRGARLLLNHLIGAGVDVTRFANPAAQDPVLLAAFCQWMRQERGAGDSTLSKYRISIRDMLKQIGEDPAKLDPRALRQFVLERSRKRGMAAAKTCTTALRMFLRFLIAEGKCAAGLDAAIPALACWRLSSLPRYLPSGEVERIIASCDPNSQVGKRDRAILLLLARLGFRAGDIVQLRLGDINWKEAWISVTGKSKRETRVPLTQEVGQAIVNYLQDGRPQSDADAIFVRSRAPFHSFANHSAVSVIVERAMRRAGVTCQNRGAAHVLRHSVATSMLRQGASLQEISAILRHRSIDTTQIYAKVDVTALAQIAQPWPVVQPC